MPRHESLPLSMTVEQLADYIRSNRAETINHVEKIALTDDDKAKLAMDSSRASRAITKLEKISKDFTTMINKGTPFDQSLGDDGDHKPYTAQIPPTKGIEKLKANRLYADEQLERDYREDVTAIYMVPWPEYEKMIGVDIEGNEWSKYSRPMKDYEIQRHGKPILAESQTLKDALDDQGLVIDHIDGKEAVIRIDPAKKKDKNKKRNLMEEESDSAESSNPDQPI
jgi:hypothetical protein